jgi:SAM-dependent methyltransferase
MAKTSKDTMDTLEIQRAVALEDRNWWYRERRAIIDRELRRLGLPPGRALDIGAAGGGNTRVLRAHGWQAVAADYSERAAELARDRGLAAMHADARRLPMGDAEFDLVTAFDVLEHIEEDHLAAAEIFRVLRPGGTALIAVPCDMALWSAHDEAVGHVRRYTRDGLRDLIEGAGLVIDALWSWNVLLRPVVARRRRSSTGSDLEELSPVVNAALSAIVTVERYLPVKSLPGVSLMMRTHRPRT